MGIFNQRNEQTPQTRGCSANLIAALFIAVIGFIMYLSQSQENPVTGEKQHISMTPDQEIKLGLQSAPLMAREMGGEVPSSDPRAQEVDRIGNLLVSRTVAHKGPWQFKFHLLEDPKTINAFALPGGQVFITLGLLNELQTEAQLAGVLGHEIGHVIERHSAEQMAKGQLGQMLILATGVGASDSNSNRSYEATMAASAVNQMLMLRYGRSDESEADLWGIKLTEQAGFDPRAMIQVMEILKKAGGSGHTPEIFQSHPNPDKRITDIKAYLEKNPPPSGLTEGKNLKEIYGSSRSSSSFFY